MAEKWDLVIILVNFLVFLVWTVMHRLCPWTKVEESFNVQAIHDLIYHERNISQYDHLEFPGVVPRTFFGPLIVGWTYKYLVYEPLLWLKIELAKPIHFAYVRFTFYMYLLYCLRRFVGRMSEVFGNDVTFWFILIGCSQFHFNFYASRPLPNTFALAFVLLVYEFYLKSDYRKAIWFATFSVFVYRSELVLFYAPIFSPIIFIERKISVISAVANGLLAAILSLAVTVPIDSYFWQRLIWPEGEVWWYNVILNKSHNWGTQPYLWYFSSALPRALGSTILLVPFGLTFGQPKKGRFLTGGALVFVFLYSFLPHKELRFIIYTIPALNLAAANVCSRVYNKSETLKPDDEQLKNFDYLLVGSEENLNGEIGKYLDKSKDFHVISYSESFDRVKFVKWTERFPYFQFELVFKDTVSVLENKRLK